MCQRFILIFFLLCFYINYAQVTSWVLDFETKVPIPYANIKVENEDFVAYADEKGKFSLNALGS